MHHFITCKSKLIAGFNVSDIFSLERNAFPLSCFLLIKCVTGNSLQTKENHNFSCVIVYQVQNYTVQTMTGTNLYNNIILKYEQKTVLLVWDLFKLSAEKCQCILCHRLARTVGAEEWTSLDKSDFYSGRTGFFGKDRR